MKKEYMKHFYHEAKLMYREEYQACIINKTDSLEACKRKVRKVTSCFESHLETAWDYFKAVYDDIPVEYRMQIMMEDIYQGYRVNYPEMLQYINHYICYEETEKLRADRVEMVKTLLKECVSEDGKVKVYRGMAEHFLMPEYAVSFTLDKSIAEFFVEYHKKRHGSRFGVVDSAEICVENILYYSNDREEQEVFVLPACVMDGYVPDSWEEMEYLDEVNMESYCWWAEDMQVIDDLYDEEYSSKEMQYAG